MILKIVVALLLLAGVVALFFVIVAADAVTDAGTSSDILLLPVTAEVDENTTTRLPVPSDSQQKIMNIGLSMFIHYSVNPWMEHIEHNCVKHDVDNCIPVSKFNPLNLSTDQWVEAAIALGANEICLTAHHEGGFCLWDTKFSDYKVTNSPYGKDVVKEFVTSCKKYNIQPCYYMGPNANGYLTNHLKLDSETFIQTQLNMLEELLTNYELQPSRLWWDHYPDKCGGLAPCPEGSFPAGWQRFIDLVRDKSPSTLICPGPDCDGHHSRESGVGKYPTWYPCEPTTDNLQCKNHNPSTSLTGFHPYEACATMVKEGWFCQGDGSTNTYWSADMIWDHYMNSVGIGWINTLNAPACTTGQINEGLVKEMTIFGTALRSLFNTKAASKDNIVLETCNNDTTTTLMIEFTTTTDDDNTTTSTSSSLSFNAVIMKEDLSHGQRITKYALDYNINGKEWIQFQNINADDSFVGVHGQSIGNLLIDWLHPKDLESMRRSSAALLLAGTTTTAVAVRFRCIEALQVPVYLKSVSLNSGTRPHDGTISNSENVNVADGAEALLLDAAVA